MKSLKEGMLKGYIQSLPPKVDELVHFELDIHQLMVTALSKRHSFK